MGPLPPTHTPILYASYYPLLIGICPNPNPNPNLPAAHRYMGNGAATTAWLIIGMLIMAVSLVLFVL